MKNLIIQLIVFLFLASSAYAYDFGTNITIWDKKGVSTETEDNEVEPGNVQKQEWDLEAFYMDGFTLTMVGGFDFKNGVQDPYQRTDINEYTVQPTYQSGDIFLDVDGVPKYGSDVAGTGYQETISNSFGYDYAIRLDFDNDQYHAYPLASGSELILTSVFFQANDSSNPWRYIIPDGAPPAFTSPLTFINDSAWLDALPDVSLWNDLGQHYAVRLDLNFLGYNVDFYSHFTMECGNDNLMGRSRTPTPEPATMVLLGTGLLGLAGFCKRKGGEFFNGKSKVKHYFVRFP